MKLENGAVIHGFKVRYSQSIPELNATLYRMEYEKNGADLVWLDRPDENKTFSIAFKTIPSDHTGVFHILEHSVLCGSRKYPVREPFVELLKSSLQTFLNAMTFPDKTMYPLCSKNDKDFLNLIDVYMDAVLHPLSLESPLGFRQEGWHYELDSPDGELTRNGVVFNEMKGAFVDPDEVLSFNLGRRMFPDNCYGYESGGHPEHIPELTYEKYLENHRRCYSPTNARIFLDGEMDLDAVLSKLDSFLCEYERVDVDAEIPMQKPVHPAELTAEYEIGPEDDDANKVIVGRAWAAGRFDEPEKNVACAVLAQALCGTNQSPLKKALLDGGLVEDVGLHSYDGIQQNFLFLAARNTGMDKKDELLRTVEQVLREQAKELDRRQLHAILNQVEFANREKDFGRMPRGLVFAMTSLESWLYGGDPAQNLQNEELFATLRRRIDEGWFEKLLEEVFITNPHTATVVLTPSKTLGQEKAGRDAKELAAIKAGWTEAETKRVIDEFAALRRHQSSGDTPEGLATLPQLSLSDIPEEMARLPYSEEKYRGTTLLRQEVETGGIIYFDMYFNADDMDIPELTKVPMETQLLGKLPTKKHSALELASLIREKIGRFSVSAASYKHTSGKVTPVLTVSLAVLPERAEEAMELTREIMFETDFTDTAAIFNILRQTRIGAVETAQNAGNSFALVRATSGHSANAAVTDAFAGVRQLRYLQETEKTFNDAPDAVADSFAAVLSKLFARCRLTLSVTGTKDMKMADFALDMLPEGDRGEAVEYSPNDLEAEGYTIPAAIGFAASGAGLAAAGAEYTGSMAVAAKLLRLDYLWNNVRVKGGAYGVSMDVSETGNLGFSSYRDPQCAGSLDIFAAAGTALRDFAKSGEDVDKYIISTIGGMEPVMTPRQEKSRAAAMYFTGRTAADAQRTRTQVLHTTKAQLADFADTLDALARKANICVIGGAPILSACGEKLTKIEPIQ